LAGDHAKSASDAGIGFVGVSLFYRRVIFSSDDAETGSGSIYTLLLPEDLPMTGAG
jgi:glucan phosphorylase